MRHMRLQDCLKSRYRITRRSAALSIVQAGLLGRTDREDLAAMNEHFWEDRVTIDLRCKSLSPDGMHVCNLSIGHWGPCAEMSWDENDAYALAEWSDEASK